jgi:hypothetical protein
MGRRPEAVRHRSPDRAEGVPVSKIKSAWIAGFGRGRIEDDAATWIGRFLLITHIAYYRSSSYGGEPQITPPITIAIVPIGGGEFRTNRVGFLGCRHGLRRTGASAADPLLSSYLPPVYSFS